MQQLSLLDYRPRPHLSGHGGCPSEPSSDRGGKADSHDAEQSEQAAILSRADFDGDSYQPAHDFSRLTGQLSAVFSAMQDGVWRTLDEIAALTLCPQQSISARLRDLRKEKFGHHSVERQRRGDPSAGIFQYRLLVNPS